MSRVGAIILAAGGSIRLGQPKQLVACGGETLVRRAVAAAITGGCAHVAVVVGAIRDQIAAELRGSAVDLVENVHWERGLGSSIKCGLEHLVVTQPELEAVVLLACDQPFVRPAIVASLLEEHIRSGKPIVACSYAGTIGIPALFARPLFASLLSLADQSGAKPLLEAEPERVAQVRFDQGAFDVDTPADLVRWRSQEAD